MKTKVCKCCGIRKAVSEFYKNKTKKGGYVNLCKKCIKEKRKIRKKTIFGFKICSCCKEEKILKNFVKSKSKKDGFSCYCKECSNKKSKEWRESNKREVRRRMVLFKETHPEYMENYTKKWKEKNPGYYNNLSKKRKETDSLYKLKGNIRCLIGGSLKTSGIKKNTKTEKILGCSFKDFKIYLESKFESWMNWENNGKFKKEKMIKNKFWHIDHIIPISSAKTEEDIIRLNHYTNFQPLDAYINCITKKNKIHHDL